MVEEEDKVMVFRPQCNYQGHGGLGGEDPGNEVAHLWDKELGGGGVGAGKKLN